MSDVIDRADRLSRRRARLFPVLAILLITQQASCINTVAQGLPLRAVDAVKISAWVLLVFGLLVALVTGGGWFRGREMRELLNDDVTRANRAAALSAGFVVAVLTGVVCYVVAMYEPTDARIAVHVIVSTGLAAALLRFGALERRAHRLG